MSQIVVVEERVDKGMEEGVSKTVKNMIREIVDSGVDISNIRIQRPRPRDPILYVNGRPVLAWVRLD